MNSYEHLSAALSRFLNSEEPGVLAVKGKWGVGKTYAWNKFLKTYRPPEKLVAHSYISLFGLRDLAEVRQAIFAKHRPFHKGTKGQLSRAGAEVSKYLKSISLGPVKDTQILSDILQERLLKNFVICIDDLERKEDSITATSLLGFIASLREERHCKVVLLYNESELEKDNQVAIAEYREKVIDREVLFEPRPAECIEIVFKDKADTYLKEGDALVSNNPIVSGDGRGLKQIFNDMGVNNLRVFQKTKLALEYFKEHIATDYPKLWPVFAGQTIKLCCLLYFHNRDYSLVEIITGEAKNKELQVGSQETHDRTKQLCDFCYRIGYRTQETDSVICDYLQNGYVDWDERMPMLKTAESTWSYNEIDSQLHEIYKSYGANFKESHTDFASRLVSFIEAHHHELSLNEFNSSIQFLKDIESSRNFEHIEALLSNKINDLIDRYPEDFGDDAQFGFYGALGKLVRQRAATKTKQIPIGQAFTKLTADSWNNSDLRHLVERTEDEVFDWISTSDDPKLLHRLKAFLERFRNSPQGREIAGRLEAALVRIGERSGLDAIRVYTFIGVPKKSASEVKIDTHRSEDNA